MSSPLTLTRAGWLYRGGLWIDPASGQRLTERAALRCHERDVARGDSDAVEAELSGDADYIALLDARKLGLSLMALIHISMDQHTPERFANFEAQVAENSEVLECLLITGQDADYQLKVVVRDMDAYQELLLNRITRIPGVTGVHSSFVLRRVVDKTAMPLAGA